MYMYIGVNVMYYNKYYSENMYHKCTGRSFKSLKSYINQAIKSDLYNALYHIKSGATRHCVTGEHQIQLDPNNDVISQQNARKM